MLIDLSIKSLHKRLSQARLEDVPKLIWMLWTMNSERCDLVRGKLNFDDEFFNPKFNSNYKMHPWRLETLFREYLISNKKPPSDRNYRILDIFHPNVTTYAINKISSIENNQDSIAIDMKSQGIDWMKRLLNQQLEWQTSLSDSALNECVFWLYLYDFDEMQEAYREVSGVGYREMFLSVVGLLASYDRAPFVNPNQSVESLHISTDDFKKALNFLSLDIGVAKQKQQMMISEHRQRAKEFYGVLINDHIGYRPSVLRKYPLVRVNGMYCAPLPPTLSYRVLNGIYFDLIGNDRIKTIIAERFESYVIRFLQKMNDDFIFLSEFYYLKKGKQASPDAIAVRDERPLIIIECKAARMDNVIRFSDKPADLAKRGADEISKGVFQIWRFVADIRNGKVGRFSEIDENAAGLIVMIDDWTSSYSSFIKKLFLMADERVAQHNEKHPGRKIEDIDKIPVRFTDIKILENTCRQIQNQDFLDFLHFSSSERYREYLLDSAIADFRETRTLGNTMQMHPMREFLNDYFSRLKISR